MAIGWRNKTFFIATAVALLWLSELQGQCEISAVSNVSASAAGGIFTFTINTANTCGWVTGPDVNARNADGSLWLTLQATGSQLQNGLGIQGKGTAQVQITLQPNCALSPRSATLQVVGYNSAGGLGVPMGASTVTQAGSVMNVTPSISVAVGDALGSFMVTNTDNCGWVAFNDNNARNGDGSLWLTLHPTGSQAYGGGGSVQGKGTQQVQFSIQPNCSLSPRSATLQVVGYDGAGALIIPVGTCTVTQAESVVSVTNVSVPASSGSGDFTVTATANCGWATGPDINARNPDGSFWLTLQATGSQLQNGLGIQGKGTGQVRINVQPNCSLSPRAATLQVVGYDGAGALNIPIGASTVKQGATTRTISPNSLAISAAGGSTSFQVATTSGCAWEATNPPPWIAFGGTPTASISGIGPATVSLMVSPNTGIQRSGTITIDSQPPTRADTLTIAQDGKVFAVSISGGPVSGTAPFSARFAAALTGGTSPYFYRWSTGEMTGPSIEHIWTTAGNFTETCTVTDSTGATATSNTLNITVTPPAAISANISGEPLCAAVPFSTTFSVSVSGGVPPFSYAWTTGETASTITHRWTTAGVYEETCVVTDSSGQRASSNRIDVRGISPLRAAFGWTPEYPVIGTTVQFQDQSSGPPSMWTWDFDDGTSSTAQSPTHTFAADGYYRVTLTVTACNISDRVTQIVPVTSCGSALQPVNLNGTIRADNHAYYIDASTYNLNQYAHNNGGLPWPPSITPPMVDTGLDALVLLLQSAMAANNVQVSRSSGYRTEAYQAHLYDIKTVYEKIKKANPSTFAACQDVYRQVLSEIKIHGLTCQKSTQNNSPPDCDKLAVSSPIQSAHTTLPAQAIDLGGGNKTRSLVEVTLLLENKTLDDFGLSDNCRADTAFHLQLNTSRICGRNIIGRAFSPVAILITDPLGRRVGFDNVTHATINEIGAAAIYSGVSAEPQTIEIDNALDGDYQMTAVATSNGPYTLTLTVVDSEHGDELESKTVAGNAVPGQTIPTLQTTGRRRAVQH